MSERRYRHPQVNLRLPEELKEKVMHLAEVNGRSANAEMVKAIEFWVSANEEMESKGLKQPKELVEIRKDQIPDIVEVVQRSVLENLVKNYKLIPKDAAELALDEIQIEKEAKPSQNKKPT